MEQKETVCSVAKKCGGCRYQGVSYRSSFAGNRELQKAFRKNSEK